MLTLETNQLPATIRNLHKPPSRLFVEGDTSLLSAPHLLSVVGSRKVTQYGVAITKQLIEPLARSGVVIVSGLALGIDSLAHRAALDAGGKTIAVLPSGINSIYPSSHVGLAKQIINSGGLIISEYPPYTKPMKHHFIERNRLISATSQATLIVEASLKSGSLHTARFALEQGRDVLAVPGNITSESSIGTNNLIKAGAQPITSADDLFAYFSLQPSEASHYLAQTAEEANILKLISVGVSEGGELLAKSGLEAPQFHTTMTMLEINQAITPLGNNYWAIK